MNGRTIRWTCAFAAALLLPPSTAMAERRDEFWPELDAFFKLDDRTRLFLMAGATRAEDSTGSGQTTQYSGGTIGAHLDFTLQPIWRSSLHGEDWERDRYIWIRAGYRHIADFDNWSGGEDRGLGELHVREPLPVGFWLTGRVKWEMRDIDTGYSNRFGARLGMEREVLLGGRAFVPYFHVEALYDTRFDTWNRRRYQAGVDITLAHRWRIEPYLTHQSDNQSEAGNVNALGLNLKYSR